MNPYVTEELLRQGEQERRRRARRDTPARQFRRRRRGGWHVGPPRRHGRSWVGRPGVSAVNRKIRARISWAAALIAAAGMAVSVGVLPGAASAALQPAAASKPAGPAVPVLDWKPCDHGFYCATARVPLNYNDPRGAQLSVAVISSRATGPGPSLGWLFFNGGGPNPQVITMSRVYPHLPSAWRERYNIIMFDPRGMGYSTQIRCFPTEAAENALLGNLPVFPVGKTQQAAYDQAYAMLDARCARYAGPLLDHDSSADIARDMNLLREAVGDPVLNYYGASYGTLFGAVYANLFPSTTGRMVLDGNLNPVAWSSGDSQLPDAARLGEPQASQATMAAFLDLCGKASAKACAFSAGTPAATTAKWITLLRLAGQHPINLGGQQGTFTYADVVAAVSLGRVAQWQGSAVLLQQLWTAAHGGKPAPSPASSPSPAPPPSGPTYYMGTEQQLAIMCADSPNPPDPAAYAAAAALGTFAPTSVWNTLGCAGWPAAAAQDRYTGPWNRPTASTILLIGNTGDPVTAYPDSLAMSRDLANARLLTVDGYGHTTVNNPSTCPINYAVTYTVTGALPAPGTVCQQNINPFP
jgi:pimeloyl-ACP methyl ester carboxylesterase